MTPRKRQIVDWEECPRCNGDRFIEAGQWPCPECRGSGEVEVYDDLDDADDRDFEAWKAPQ